ncbi:MAG: DegT/DnrJ/EryC1/StrS family aminotransferase [Planctomycetes bacterium]|nr:DegT/DnrJ/EryC1/StrS family aminotransferase [Planctomycetota bacterium]
MERIPVAGPSITQREIDYVTEAVTSCWYGNANHFHDRFERAFADYIGTKYAVALPSCTSAIHLSLAALGVGPGDEVIVPDVTWIASAAPVEYVGASPVFADIDPDTWCLSPESLARNITERTRSVIIVDLYGNMPRMDELLAIARQHDLTVIEDAAEAFGSEYRGRKAGLFGDAAVFSFHGSKTMTTGEGGMFVTDRKDLYDRALILRDHGRVPGDVSFFNREVAFKYKMSSFQAAIGLAQVERAEELVARKREIFGWYSARLADLPNITLNPEPAHVRNSYWMSTIVLDPALGLTKERLVRELAARQIDSRPFFYPLSHIPAYRDRSEAKQAQAQNAVAYRVSPYGVNLPCGLSLTEAQVDRVCAEVRSILDSVAASPQKAA